MTCICPKDWVRPWWRCPVHGTKPTHYSGERIESELDEDDPLEAWAREIANE